MPCAPNEVSRFRHWVCALQIAERRRALGLTQQEVVDRLGVRGVATTNRTLSAMEHGQGIDVGRLPEVAIALECTVTYLLGLTGDPHSWTPDDVSAWPVGQPAPGEQPCWLTDPGQVTVTANERPSLRRFTEHAEPAVERRGSTGRAVARRA